jgi:hypothetical protein
MRFDSSAVLGVADQMGAAAELLDRAVADHLVGLTFGGPVAGRDHAARGEALRAALQRLTAEVAQWSRAAAATAAALRTGAENYADAETYAAARIA